VVKLDQRRRKTIDLKITALICQCWIGIAPIYLIDLAPIYCLSTLPFFFLLPHLNNNFGDCAFSIVTPKIYNSVPLEILLLAFPNSSNTFSFRKYLSNLKTNFSELHTRNGIFLV
jgi:hypothetical protein